MEEQKKITKKKEKKKKKDLNYAFSKKLLPVKYFISSVIKCNNVRLIQKIVACYSS